MIANVKTRRLAKAKSQRWWNKLKTKGVVVQFVNWFIAARWTSA